jgi:SAM-dependent methyltransferase
MSFDYESNPQSLLLPENIKYHLHLQHIFKLIKKQLRDTLPVKILEIGCGGGVNLYAIKQQFGDSVEVYGSDISHTAISFAKNLSIGEFKQGTADQCCFSEIFDIVIISDVLEHLPSIEHVIRTLETIQTGLKNSGLFYLCCPIELNPFSMHWWFNKLGIFANNTRKFYGHLIQFRRDQLVDLLQKHFSIDETRYSCHFFGQLQTLLFFVLPKEILTLFGTDVEKTFRDSNVILEQKDNKMNIISFLRNFFNILISPFMFVSYYESQLRKHDKFAANTIHVAMSKLK